MTLPQSGVADPQEVPTLTDQDPAEARLREVLPTAVQILTGLGWTATADELLAAADAHFAARSATQPDYRAALAKVTRYHDALAKATNQAEKFYAYAVYRDAITEARALLSGAAP